MKNTRVQIRVLSGFIMNGREPTQIGEEFQVSRTFAAELVCSGKAEVIPSPPPKPDPNFMPQIEPEKPADAKPKVKT